jgi:hypothetical protein
MNTFSMKNTKAQLLAEVERLQVLESQSRGISLIAKGSKMLYDDVAYELPLLVRDIRSAGHACRQLVRKVELPTFV